MTFVWVRKRSCETGRGWQVGLDQDYTSLICVLIVGEEEQLVLKDRAADPDTRISPCKERIRSRRVSRKTGICSHIVITEEEVSRSMKLISARASDDINRTY